MKKVIGISMVAIIVLTVASGIIWLRQSKKEEILQEIVPIEDGASVSLYSGTLTRSGANFSVEKRFTEDEIEYAFNSNYRIDQKKDGIWTRVPLLKKAKKIDTTETYAGGEEWVDWTERYGKLSNGEYRYVKSMDRISTHCWSRTIYRL